MPIFGMYLIKKDGSLGEDVSVEFMGHPTHRGADYPYRDGGRESLPSSSSIPCRKNRVLMGSV